MSSRIPIIRSTGTYSDNVRRLRDALDAADAVVIGAGAGLSASAGFAYTGERFETYFSDFAAKYGFRDMYSGGFWPFPSPQEFWAYWSRYVFINRYMDAPKPVYADLLALVREKDYFVITTNVDHCFQKAGFDKQRLFYTQGDYGLFQCGRPCHNATYDNEEIIRKMTESQGYTVDADGTLLPPGGRTAEKAAAGGRDAERTTSEERGTGKYVSEEQRAVKSATDERGAEIHAAERFCPKMKVPADLIPYCPKCGSPMRMNLRADDTFVEDGGWHDAARRYEAFLNSRQGRRVLFLELGVGGNTPVIIKYPFWRMTAQNPRAIYACVNYGEAVCPPEISGQAICIDADIGEVLAALAGT